jgi:acetyltransferase-like isoleucine patch superfamily enzyme
MNNSIHSTAKIAKNVKIGSYNHIGRNVIIMSKNNESQISIGDNNTINDNVRIIISDGHFEMGDWNIIHNDTLLLSTAYLRIKNNVWIGQNSVLDGTGGLIIKNGVRIGMQSQIWSHAKTAEEIEGCILNVAQPTIIEDEVWIQGNSLIGSGISIGHRSIGLLGSVLHQSIGPNKVFKGNPAKEVKGLKMYRKVSETKKMRLMSNWSSEFKTMYCPDLEIIDRDNQINLSHNSDKIIISLNEPPKIIANITYFIISGKKFIKTNSLLERRFYQFLFSNKARFNQN